jgi:hypothetical protein
MPCARCIKVVDDWSTRITSLGSVPAQASCIQPRHRKGVSDDFCTGIRVEPDRGTSSDAIHPLPPSTGNVR